MATTKPKTFFDTYKDHFPRDKNHLVQLALPREKVPASKPLKFPLLASEKLDGVFAFAVRRGLTINIYSRTGEEYVSLKHLQAELWEILRNAETSVLIFEAYAAGVDQPTISGWCRDTKNQHSKVHAYIHDIMSFREFKGDSVTLPYHERYQILNKAYSQQPLPFCHIIPQFEVNSWEEVEKLAGSIWNMGGEGVILRNPDAPYSPGKRNSDIVKVKKGVSYDLEVLDVQEGTGKYQGMAGALICQYKGDKTVIVGSGLVDAQRRQWYEDKNLIVGKIVQVDAMDESTKGVLREPRFKGIRHDKQQGDF